MVCLSRHRSQIYMTTGVNSAISALLRPAQLNPGEMAAIMGSLRRMPSGNLYEGFPCVRVGDYLLPSSMDLRAPPGPRRSDCGDPAHDPNSNRSFHITLCGSACCARSLRACCMPGKRVHTSMPHSSMHDDDDTGFEGCVARGQRCARELVRGSSADLTLSALAGQFLNEMQEVGELSPAVSPVKSPAGNASAFASLVKQEEVTAEAGVTADSSPADDAADGPETARHAEPLEPSGELKAAHALRGGSADEHSTVANGGPVHAASGELEGTEHLHSGAVGDVPTGGEDADAIAEAAAMADRVALVAACLKAEASAHATGPAQLSSKLAAATSARSSEGVTVEPGTNSDIDIGGQQAVNGIDQSGDMAVDVDGTSQTGAALTTAGAGQPVPGQSTAPAQEQQFTCKVCDITTSTETHMQVRLQCTLGC